MQPVYLAGVGMTKFGKDPRSLVEILCQAAQQALKETHVQTVEALYIGAMNPEEFTGDSNIASQMAEELGLTGIPACESKPRLPPEPPRFKRFSSDRFGLLPSGIGARPARR